MFVDLLTALTLAATAAASHGSTPAPPVASDSTVAQSWSFTVYDETDESEEEEEVPETPTPPKAPKAPKAPRSPRMAPTPQPLAIPRLQLERMMRNGKRLEMLSGLDENGHGARIDTSISIATRSGAQFELQNYDGDITVMGWARDVVWLEAQHSPRVRVLIRQIGPKISVTSVGRYGPATVDYTIKVPTWMPLNISSVNSDITIDGTKSDVHAESVKGDVAVRGGSGVIEANSVEGDVKIMGPRGRVSASSINSGLSLFNVIGPVEVQTVNGDIELDKMDSDSIQASSINGEVRFEGAFRPRGAYQFSSHNGNLVIGIPVGIGLDVSVATWNGDFESTFPLTLQTRKGKRFNFTLGTGGSALDLESFQGAIRLTRAGEAIHKEE